ncbi:MAG TPA: CHAT domain-containing protein, partial [Chitinophagaceae bacterium]|nr:CHAT domain-containing protein [Chitinophagaceae bacterium]
MKILLFYIKRKYTCYIVSIFFTIFSTPLFYSTTQAQTFAELNKLFISLYDNGKYDSAVLIGEKALIQCEKEYGKKDINYAISYLNIADAYAALKKISEAVLNYSKSIEVFAIVYNTYENIDIALIDNKIGSQFYSIQLYDTATTYFLKSIQFFYKHPNNNYESLYNISLNIIECCIQTANYNTLLLTANQALPFVEANNSKESEAYYTMFYYKGFALYNLEQYDKAEYIYKNILPIAEKLYGKNNSEYITVLKYYFRILSKLEKWNKAEETLSEILQIQERIGYEDVQDVAELYEEAGNFYASIGNYSKAENCFKLALNTLENAGKKNSDLYYSILHSKAYVIYQAGKLIETKDILENLLKVYTKKNGRVNATNAEILIVLAGAEIQLNYLAAAKEHLDEGYNMTIKVHGKEYPTIANAKESYGLWYNKTGDSKKSIENLKDGIQLLEKIQTTNYNIQYTRLQASLHSNIGITYLEMGKYADAENHLTQSLQIREKILGIKHPEYALSLINLGVVHLYQARYEEADKMLLAALKIYLDNNLTNTVNFYYLINNIALLAEKTNGANQAKVLYQNILTILEKNNSTNSAVYSIIYGNLATLSFNKEMYEDALHYCTKAIHYLEQGNNQNSKEYIKILNTQFLAYKNKKEFGMAAKMSNPLIELTKKIMGNDAELTGIVYNNIAMLYEELNDVEKAADFLNKGNGILLNNFKQNFYILSEKEKLTWWNNQSFIFNIFPSMLMQFNITEGKWVEAFANRQIQIKGFVLSDSKNTLNVARNNKNKEVKNYLDKWQYNKDLLSKLYSQPLQDRIYSTDSLEQKANTLEKKINQLSAGNVQLNHKTYTWQNVQQQLQPNEVAIEFISFPFYRNNKYSDSVQYAALVISKTAPPKFIQLGTLAKLEHFMQGKKTDSKELNIHRLYRSRLAKKEASFYGDSIYNFLWKPLEEYIKGSTNIAYAPDGILHKLAFQALPVDSNKILLDKFQLQQYSSILQIAERKKENVFNWQSALLFGGINFNEAKVKNKTTINYQSSSAAYAALPATINEISGIEKIFLKNKLTITTVSGSKATEEFFKSINNHSPQILHIATHGYFLKEVVNTNSTNLMLRGEQLISTSENSLLRSGLVLAGANKAWSGEKLPDSLEDGILSAYEISKLNLSNTKLV